MHRFGFGALKQTVMDHGDATATVTGTTSIGSLLTCTFNNNDPDGAAVSGPTFQWYWADTVTQISGATSSTYTIQGTDAGHTIKCRCIYTDPGGTVETIFSNDTAGISAPLTSSFNAQVGSATASASYTFNTVSTGTANATRYTVMCVFSWGSNRSCSGVSLNGTPMTKIFDSGDGSHISLSMWIVFNPTGTTNDVAVTFSGIVSTGCAIASYSIIGNSTITVEDFETQNTANPIGITLNTVIGGCWIAVGERPGGTVTISNQGTADFNVVVTPATRRVGAHADTSSNAVLSPGWTFSSATETYVGGVSWRSGS